MKSEVKIAIWNINSINIRVHSLIDWVNLNNPDIILLQEIKCVEEKFPFELLEDLKYNICINGQKSYHGVAILSKFPIENILTSFDDNPIEDEARFIQADINLPIGISKIISLYAPNGGEVGSDKFIKKLDFFDKLTKYLNNIKDPSELLFIGGDFNIAKEDIDVYDPQIWQNSTCFTLQERKKLRAVLNQGFIDTYRILNPDTQAFTWWNYKTNKLSIEKGIRIDYILSSMNTSEYIKKFKIHQDVRMQPRPSDHAPCVLHLSK